MKILDEVKKKRKIRCREIAEEFKMEKTQAANVVTNEARLKTEYEKFQGKCYKHIKRGNHQIFKTINDILKKCEASGICVPGPILKEEAMNIKSLLNQSVLEDFRASDFRAFAVLERTVESWIERIKEICTGNDCHHIWNMEESGCFFKALPSK